MSDSLNYILRTLIDTLNGKNVPETIIKFSKIYSLIRTENLYI